MTVVNLHGTFEFQPDTDLVLEAMKGRQFSKLLILASYPDTSFEIAGNCTTAEALYLMEVARFELMNGGGDD